jgi:hypothetical protein
MVAIVKEFSEQADKHLSKVCLKVKKKEEKRKKGNKEKKKKRE